MKFYIKDFCYIKSAEEIDVSSIPPLVRRKLSPIDKAALSTMIKVFDNNVEEIVFSSQYGEHTRLDTLIAQYKEAGEVSPAQFSGSVHNYPAGFFTLINKLNIPYYALSAGENSFYAGLVKSVISGKETMFTYADTYNEIKAVSVLISPSEESPVTLKEVDYENFIEILMQL